MVQINPLDVLLWILRRSQKDVIKLYSTMSPLMQIATGGRMLNFGYWTESHSTPLDAQRHLCSHFGRLAELGSAERVIDVGSGLSAPARQWREEFEGLHVSCANINYSQLRSGHHGGIASIACSSTAMPFAAGSADRILALESSQHFRPFSDFALESRRILADSGLLVLAVPVTLVRPSAGKLGILKFTWSSEHYTADQIREFVRDAGFAISAQELIGKSVYCPLADYYFENRPRLQRAILQHYPPIVERILFWSLQKMRQASESGVIDYLLLKCRL